MDFCFSLLRLGALTAVAHTPSGVFVLRIGEVYSGRGSTCVEFSRVHDADYLEPCAERLRLAWIGCGVIYLSSGGELKIKLGERQGRGQNVDRAVSCHHSWCFGFFTALCSGTDHIILCASGRMLAKSDYGGVFSICSEVFLMS